MALFGPLVWGEAEYTEEGESEKNWVRGGGEEEAEKKEEEGGKNAVLIKGNE